MPETVGLIALAGVGLGGSSIGAATLTLFGIQTGITLAAATGTVALVGPSLSLSHLRGTHDSDQRLPQVE